MTWAATLESSDPKDRRDACLLAVIGFSHAENMAVRATRCVANDDHPIAEHAEAKHPRFSVVLAYVSCLEIRPTEDFFGVLEVEATSSQGICTFLRIVRDCHPDSVAT